MTTQYRSDELVCADAPKGQLPYEASADTVAERYRSNDEAGEDCRQKLSRVRLKDAVTQATVAEANKKPVKK